MSPVYFLPLKFRMKFLGKIIMNARTTRFMRLLAPDILCTMLEESEKGPHAEKEKLSRSKMLINVIKDRE